MSCSGGTRQSWPRQSSRHEYWSDLLKPTTPCVADFVSCLTLERPPPVALSRSGVFCLFPTPEAAQFGSRFHQSCLSPMAQASANVHESGSGSSAGGLPAGETIPSEWANAAIGVIMAFDQHSEYNPIPRMDARHLTMSPSQLGDCSMHELRCNYGSRERSTPTHKGDGVMATLLLSPLPKLRVWTNNTEMAVAPSLAGQFRFVDLRNSRSAEIPVAVHSIALFMPNSAFAKRGSPKWNWDESRFSDDAVLSHLFRAMIPSLRNPDFQDELFFGFVLQAASRHIAAKYTNRTLIERTSAQRLSKEQENKAKEILMSRIAGNVSVDEVAAECGVSPDHFGRTFKSSAGLPPYRWLTLQRIDRAKSMLASSDGSLVEISLACGFSNQSHMTRVFSREVGLSPGQWRTSRSIRS
jgi:AraC family transcriptional regulator